MNPLQVAKNRTARLAAEAKRPVYTTETGSPFLPSPSRMDLIKRAQEAACTEDFCFICSRCTDHFGEHSVEQILAWANKKGMK